mmetsp:Transcript_99109/g.319534  ORF Transcript_99109/g.319534 Transcript_99109/m.319534 type:complete len:216 (+) Transcript_99109:923-1570(+)
MFRKIPWLGLARTKACQKISEAVQRVHCRRWMMGKTARSSSFASSARTPRGPACRRTLSTFRVTLSSCLSQLFTWVFISCGRTNSRTPGSSLAAAKRASCATFCICSCFLRPSQKSSALSTPQGCCCSRAVAACDGEAGILGLGAALSGTSTCMASRAAESSWSTASATLLVSVLTSSCMSGGAWAMSSVLPGSASAYRDSVGQCHCDRPSKRLT